MGPKHLEEPFNLKYEVVKIVYRDMTSGFAILKGKILEHNSKDEFVNAPITIKGYYKGLYEGDELESEVIMLEDKKVGYYLKTIGINRTVVPHQSKELVKFIKKRTKGVGDTIIKRCVGDIGLDFADKIKDNFDSLLNVQGMTEKKARQIYDSVITHIMFEDLTTYLVANGISANIANQIYDVYDESSLYKIKKNPYLLSRIKGINFKKADSIAKAEGFKYNNPVRLKNAIYQYLVMRIESYSDICITKYEIIKGLNSFFHRYGAFKEDPDIPELDIESMINHLIKKGKLSIERIDSEKDKPEDKQNVWIYFPQYQQVENNIVQSVVQMLYEPFVSEFTDAMIDVFLENYEEEYSMTIDEKQKQAVHNALKSKLSILSGGPGTGKTHTTNIIVKCLMSLKPDAKIVLLAPTGKASNRMTELTNLPASTIHRKLKLRESDNYKTEVEQIDADFVVVDESSMIDVFIFNELLNSIGDETSLLLVGDYHQLPSVGPGLIFKDLITSQVVPTTVLTKIFRQSQNSQIIQNANKILHGKTTKDEDGLTFDRSKGDFDFIERETQQEVQEALVATYKKALTKYSLQEVCLLSPMNIGELGTIVLNNILQNMCNPASSQKEELVFSHDKRFRVGDKVIHTKNNADLNVSNGETGIITYIGMMNATSSDTYVAVEYPHKDDVVIYNEKLAREELELAYAISIHKSQGSEYPVIIMPIVQIHELMLRVNLIYTAWTRAKKKVVVVGSKDALDDAVVKKPAIERRSQLKEKLMKFHS